MQYSSDISTLAFHERENSNFRFHTAIFEVEVEEHAISKNAFGYKNKYFTSKGKNKDKRENTTIFSNVFLPLIFFHSNIFAVYPGIEFADLLDMYRLDHVFTVRQKIILKYSLPVGHQAYLSWWCTFAKNIKNRKIPFVCIT